MNLVSAELKSKEELKERLEAGEVFWYRGEKIFYDELRIYSGKSPFAICENALEGSWECYLHLQKEVLWYENIEKPVLCWVSHMSKNRRAHVKYIKSQGANGGFIDNEDGEHWVYATPVTPEDLTKD